MLIWEPFRVGEDIKNETSFHRNEVATRRSLGGAYCTYCPRLSWGVYGARGSLQACVPHYLGEMALPPGGYLHRTFPSRGSGGVNVPQRQGQQQLVLMFQREL